ncbi:MAG: flagellar biosynthetic protein FliO [Deltaproteobacteria bacterium]|nr:flagellar biosynthetic protein FliO [Deltaproteobacteria bacterium]
MDNATLSQNAMDIGSTGLKMASSLLVVLALLLLGFYLLRRFSPRLGFSRPSSVLHLVSRLGIGPRKEILVVRFLNKLLIIGVTETQMTLLGEELADHVQDPDFASVLEKHQKEGLASLGRNSAGPGLAGHKSGR